MTLLPPRRILSIQSHVTSGYVGNRAAVFPLQLLGYDVDVLNSCMLANHTGYKNGARGLRLTGDDLTTVIEGMRSNGLLNQITHILTGYIGTPTFLNAVVDTVQLLRHHLHLPITFVCDPVLGDNGNLYVPRELVQIYIDKVLKHASILTPNCFELGLLSESPIHSEADAFAACDKLHALHNIPTIFVTGARFTDALDDKVSVLVSSQREGTLARFAIDSDFITGNFTGTGDLMSALLLAWMDKFPDDVLSASSRAMASVAGVLKRTVSMPKTDGHCPNRELRLIQSQGDILQPPINLVRPRKVNA